MRQRINFKTIYWSLLFLICLVCSWQSWAWWSWAIAPSQNQSNNQENNESNSVQIYIPSGTAAQQIGKDLREIGLIKSLTAWKLWTVWLTISAPKGSFKAGTYAISLTEPLPKIANQIWQGKTLNLSITIPEGWSIPQMAEYFAALGYFSDEDFIAATRKIDYQKYPWLPPDLPHLEGFLFPDTYQFSKPNITPQEVITMMLDRFAEVALPIYKPKQKQLNLNLRQWVTLASIVEKEAAIASERPLIAGVFANRLLAKMKLESDPTVEYAFDIKQTVDQPLTWKQVQTPSPYNTYTNTGLPPTAIASPSKASLEATLNPAATDYLYFVAKYDGTHVFSKTLAQHRAAVTKIRQEINKINNSQP